MQSWIYSQLCSETGPNLHSFLRIRSHSWHTRQLLGCLATWTWTHSLTLPVQFHSCLSTYTSLQIAQGETLWCKTNWTPACSLDHSRDRLPRLPPLTTKPSSLRSAPQYPEPPGLPDRLCTPPTERTNRYPTQPVSQHTIHQPHPSFCWQEIHNKLWFYLLWLSDYRWSICVSWLGWLLYLSITCLWVQQPRPPSPDPHRSRERASYP